MTSQASQKRQLTSGTMPASKKQATGKTKTQKTGSVTKTATDRDEDHYVYVVTFQFNTYESNDNEFNVVGIYRVLEDANNAARKKANAEDPRSEYAQEFLDKDGCVQIQNQEAAEDRMEVNVERQLIKPEGSEPETKLGVTDSFNEFRDRYEEDDEDEEEYDHDEDSEE